MSLKTIRKSLLKLFIIFFLKKITIKPNYLYKHYDAWIWTEFDYHIQGEKKANRERARKERYLNFSLNRFQFETREKKNWSEEEGGGEVKERSVRLMLLTHDNIFHMTKLPLP